MDGRATEMKYSKVKQIQIIPKKDDEKWCIVIFEDGSQWIPRMEEIATLYNYVGICEDYKYKPNGIGAKYAFNYFDEVYNEQCNTMDEARQLYIDKYDPKKKTKRLYK